MSGATPSNGTLRLTMAQALVKWMIAPVRRARRAGAAILRRNVGHLRPRKRRGCGTGARSVSRRAAVRALAQRAGAGARGGSLCAAEQPAADVGLHHFRRARSNEHGDRRGGSDDQSASGVAPSGRHLRQPARRAGVAAAGISMVARADGERRVQARISLLGSHCASGAVARRGAGSDAGTHGPGGHRGGHARASSGCAGRSVRLSRDISFGSACTGFIDPRPMQICSARSLCSCERRSARSSLPAAA